MSIQDQIGVGILALIVLFGGAACLAGIFWLLNKAIPLRKLPPGTDSDITSPTDFMDMNMDMDMDMDI